MAMTRLEVPTTLFQTFAGLGTRFRYPARW